MERSTNNTAHALAITTLLIIAAVASQMGRKSAADLGVSDRISGISVFIVWPVVALVTALWSGVLAIRRKKIAFGILAAAAVALLAAFAHVMSGPN